jgi:hypothetical protein
MTTCAYGLLLVLFTEIGSFLFDLIFVLYKLARVMRNCKPLKSFANSESVGSDQAKHWSDLSPNPNKISWRKGRLEHQ